MTGIAELEAQVDQQSVQLEQFHTKVHHSCKLVLSDLPSEFAIIVIQVEEIVAENDSLRERLLAATSSEDSNIGTPHFLLCHA